MSDSNDGFFKDGNSISVVNLTQWLDWSGGTKDDVFVALPMIQRGSVWKPNQIIDLWDTLLRGMPVGSLMTQTLSKGEKVRKVGGDKLVDIPQGGGLSLLDGQQRTLSMLIPWEKQVRMDKKIWIDFRDKPQDEHLYHLRVTTENHPFGFQKASPSTRLSLGDRNKARMAYLEEYPNDRDATNTEFFEHSKPWGSVFPVDLYELITLWKTHKNKEICKTFVLERLKEIRHFEFDRYEENEGTKTPKFNEIHPWGKLNNEEIREVERRVSDFYKSIERLFSLQIPIIKIGSEIFDGNKAESNQTQDDIAPPLAVLFKRIGTGGTTLTDADYVYSLIKYRLPEAYTLVESLHGKPNVASLLSATNVVMSAVRLAAAEFNDGLPSGDKRRITDWESPNKKQFHSMLNKEGFLHENWRENIEVKPSAGLLPILEDDSLKTSFDMLSNLLEYEPQNGPSDIGLPKYAFPLLNRPLVQVLLRWIRQVQFKYPNDAENICKNNNRASIVRFVLYWRVFVLDAKEASRLAFDVLAQNKDPKYFPDKIIYEKLKEELAIPIVTPEAIKHIAFSAKDAKLRGWRRFHITKETLVEEKDKIKLYQRWWGHGGHVHPILLWLQRNFVSAVDGDPMAGRDEETPYDYDHICPGSYWYNNSKNGGNGTRIIDYFAEKDGEGHWRVGNSIGNVRVWGSSANRSDGDGSPTEKILDRKNCDEILKQSAIKPEHSDYWRDCGKGREWDLRRVKAFQEAVEHRAFALYQSYYIDLGFDAWLGSEAHSISEK